jgi:hypothetical protein
VSNGTTLTFTAAPSSNSGNNIFVYYLFRTVGTVSHPSNNALSATSGTFTGDVTIGDASAADKKILFDGNAQDFHIGLDDSADSLTIGLGSTLGTTSHMVFDSTGAITKPLQPAFLAKPSTAQNNLTNNPSGVDLLFATEVFDQNADYNNSNYTFTAPVTGKYNLFAHAYLYNLDGDANVIYITLATSNRSIYGIIDPNFGQDNEYWTLTVSMIFDMDANDTAKVTWLQSGGTAQTSLQPSSHFGGHLVA